jgi:hypothetical protein
VTATDEERREAAAALEACKAAGGTARRIDPNRSNANREGEGVTAAAELPVYPGPAPATLGEAAALMDGIGTRYRALSPETEAAILALQAEALEAEPDAEATTAATADREDLEDQAEPDPDDQAPPVPEPTGEGVTVPIVADIAMRIWPEAGENFPAEFMQGGRRLFLTTARTPPWNSLLVQKRWANQLIEALGDAAPMAPAALKKKVTGAFVDFAERLENDPDIKKALTPAAVRRVLARTKAIAVYPSTETTYVIRLGTRDLRVPIKDMARTDPAFINTAWLNLFPTEPLNATRREWLQIQAAWTDPAVVEIRETEEASEDEIIIERLRAYLEKLTLVTSADAFTADTLAWHDERAGWVWVMGTAIARFIEDDLKRLSSWSSALSVRLRENNGPMPRTSMTIRVGGFKTPIRCWPFRRDFATFKTNVPVLDVRDVVEAGRDPK